MQQCAGQPLHVSNSETKTSSGSLSYTRHTLVGLDTIYPRFKPSRLTASQPPPCFWLSKSRAHSTHIQQEHPTCLVEHGQCMIIMQILQGLPLPQLHCCSRLQALVQTELTPSWLHQPAQWQALIASTPGTYRVTKALQTGTYQTVFRAQCGSYGQHTQRALKSR